MAYAVLKALRRAFCLRGWRNNDVVDWRLKPRHIS